MSPIFRVLLIVVSLLTTFYILKKIRQSKLQIEYAIFWILFAGVLIVFSLFPWLVSMFTRLIGMQLPRKLHLHVLYLCAAGENVPDDHRIVSPGE